MVGIILKQDKQPLFAFPSILSNEYRTKEHGSLFISKQNRVDTSRGLRISLGAYIAGPLEFFEKYPTTAFGEVTQVPAPTLDLKTKQPIYKEIKVVVINVEKDTNWKEIEKLYISANTMVDSDSKAMREVHAENKFLRDTIEHLNKRLEAIERGYTGLTTPKSKITRG